jgi:ceramide glucosyltransferase
VVEQLQKTQAGRDLDLVIETKAHGLNRKVSNLVNMAPRIRHNIVVLADSDMRVDSDYLSRVTAALDEPGVGAVTCLYYGVPLVGMWSSLSALAINAHFLPGVVFGLTLGLARPCFGSTLALRRQTLGEIGGFIAFVDCLADDYAMGAALRARGHTISIPPFAVAHMCTEASAHEFWRHELRWARTIKSIDPRPSAAMGADRRAARRRLDRIPAGDRHRAGVHRMPDDASAAGREGLCPASASVLACARA